MGRWWRTVGTNSRTQTRLHSWSLMLKRFCIQLSWDNAGMMIWWTSADIRSNWGLRKTLPCQPHPTRTGKLFRCGLNLLLPLIVSGCVNWRQGISLVAARCLLVALVPEIVRSWWRYSSFNIPNWTNLVQLWFIRRSTWRTGSWTNPGPGDLDVDQDRPIRYSILQALQIGKEGAVLATTWIILTYALVHVWQNIHLKVGTGASTGGHWVSGDQRQGVRGQKRGLNMQVVDIFMISICGWSANIMFRCRITWRFCIIPIMQEDRFHLRSGKKVKVKRDLLALSPLRLF